MESAPNRADQHAANSSDMPEPAAYVDHAAYVFWDEQGSFGFDVRRRAAAEVRAASALQQ